MKYFVGSTSRRKSLRANGDRDAQGRIGRASMREIGRADFGIGIIVCWVYTRALLDFGASKETNETRMPN